MTKNEFQNMIKQYQELIVFGPMPFPVGPEKSTTIPVIYVDGGIQHKSSHNKRAEISIGDNDSNQSSHPIDITLETEKDHSDLEAALELIPSHISKVYLWGFLGGRIDHLLINIGSIHRFLKNSSSQRICYFDNKILAISHSSITLNHQGHFSLMSLEKQKVKISGDCHYKLDHSEIDVLSSLTLSNIAKGEVHIESELPLFIYLN